MQLPCLVTERLVLRPFGGDDEAIHGLVFADPWSRSPSPG
jgi:hypothetical protein